MNEGMDVHLGDTAEEIIRCPLNEQDRPKAAN